MGILDELLTGGQRRKDYGDFVKRYEEGDPSEGYSDQEVLKRYGEVSHAVAPDQYAQAAQEALSKLSPEERAAFVKMLQDRAATRGVTLPRQVAPEPKDLGQVLTDLHAKPGQLRDMLGGGAAQPQGQASGSVPSGIARHSAHANRIGGRNEYSLDHHNWICGGHNREVLISRKQVRAHRVHLDDRARDYWSFCSDVPWPGGWVV